MSLSEHDARDLEWALGVGWTKFQRSVFGAQLERSRNLKYDSTGHIIPKARWWQSFTSVKREQTEPSYTPSLLELERFARVSRVLLAVERRSTGHCAALVAYYGDNGARWGLEKAGRIAALYPLTSMGREVVCESRKRYTTSEDIRDDEIIATDLVLQERNPKKRRAKQLATMATEAEALLMAANLTWKACARAVAQNRPPKTSTRR